MDTSPHEAVTRKLIEPCHDAKITESYTAPVCESFITPNEHSRYTMLSPRICCIAIQWHFDRSCTVAQSKLIIFSSFYFPAERFR